MKLKHYIAVFSCALILFSCAQIVPLSGGEKDIHPPKEIESLPQNGSINFSEKTIVIEFDEYIKLTNVTSQLIVSPLMDTPPEVQIKGKKLVIKLESELTPNTTYSINFGNAITDITEDNVFPNYKYVFSTGTYIDSLSYSGIVVNSFDLEKKENIYVLLYDQFEDSVPLIEMPRYVALTDKDGQFSITNIANGTYKLFAINDINGNYLFDLPNEAIGFKSELITLDSSSTENIISLFEEEGGLQYVEKAENKKYGKIDIILNQPTQNLTVTPLNIFFKQKWYYEERSQHGDSLILWLTTTEGFEDLEILLKDGADFSDTAEVNIVPREEFKDTSLQIATNVSGIFDLNQDVLITTKRPVKKTNTANITLFEDSNKVLYNWVEVQNPLRKFTIEYPFKENSNYQLLFLPEAFTDILGLKNDTVKIDFQTKSESDYGILNLDIKPNFSDNYILQLFKGKKLVQERFLKDAEKINFKYLLPGDYSFKLIIDANNNNKWNSGNYLGGIQPEKVIYYEKEIKIKANWDNDIIWTINE